MTFLVSFFFLVFGLTIGFALGKNGGFFSVPDSDPATAQDISKIKEKNSSLPTSTFFLSGEVVAKGNSSLSISVLSPDPLKDNEIKKITIVETTKIVLQKMKDMGSLPSGSNVKDGGLSLPKPFVEEPYSLDRIQKGDLASILLSSHGDGTADSVIIFSRQGAPVSP